MNDIINKRVQVGQRLVKYDGEQLLDGLYVYNEFVFASIVGVVSKKEGNAFFVANHFPVKCVDIRIGDIVYGKVTKIRE
jgi:exosome complex RNA-binding protein Csl4